MNYAGALQVMELIYRESNEANGPCSVRLNCAVANRLRKVDIGVDISQCTGRLIMLYHTFPRTGQPRQNKCFVYICCHGDE